MALIAFLPEVAAFLIFNLIATQLPGVGAILLLTQFAIVGLLALSRPAAVLDILLRWWPLLLLPLLATVSAFWSDLPAASARYGAQLLFTVSVGVVLARLMSPQRYVTVLMLAMFVFCILCIINGRTGPSMEGPVLVGLTGSKNQMGFAALMLLMSACAVLVQGGVARVVRWIALAALPLSMALAIGTHSATALVTAVGGSFAVFGLWYAQRFTPGVRAGVLIVAAIILAPLSMLLPEIIDGVNRFMFETLDKDPTLTGRTYLWAVADDLISRRPALGYGYMSFWLGESPDNLGILRASGLVDGRTFNFHHQFRQTAVDMGYLGVGIMILTMLIVGLSALRQFLLRPDAATTFFFLMFALIVARCTIEVFMVPFSIQTVIFISSCVYAFWRPAPAEAGAPTRFYGAPQYGARS